MSKNTGKATVEFTEFVEPEKVNPYTDDVAKLAEQNNENAALVVTVDANQRLKHQLLIQKAANAIGKTARLRITDDSGAKITGKTEKGKPIYEGVIKMTFTLTGKHKVRRGKDESAK